MSDTQKLVQIDLVYKKWSRATRNGNNAAWNCSCGKGTTPLLGGGLPNSRGKPVQCPECGSKYEVIFGDDNKPTRVEQL